MEQQGHGKLISQVILNYKIKAPMFKEIQKPKPTKPINNVSDNPSKQKKEQNTLENDFLTFFVNVF